MGSRPPGQVEVVPDAVVGLVEVAATQQHDPTRAQRSVRNIASDRQQNYIERTGGDNCVTVGDCDGVSKGFGAMATALSSVTHPDFIVTSVTPAAGR